MSIELAQLIEEALQTWSQAGVQLLSPLDGDTVRIAFNQIDRKVSADVLQLYQSCDGFADYDLYYNCWGLWSLNRIVEWNTKASEWSKAVQRKQIGFADVMIDSFFFCFQYENENVSSVWVETGEELRLAANSVSEFLAIFLSDPKKLGLLGPNWAPPGSPERR